MLDLSLDQVHLAAAGGKLRWGKTARTDEELQRLLNNPRGLMPDVR